MKKIIIEVVVNYLKVPCKIRGEILPTFYGQPTNHHAPSNCPYQFCFGHCCHKFFNCSLEYTQCLSNPENLLGSGFQLDKSTIIGKKKSIKSNFLNLRLSFLQKVKWQICLLFQSHQRFSDH